MEEQMPLAQLDDIERESIEERLRLVRGALPEIWHDAEQFVSGRRDLAWELVARLQADAQELKRQVSRLSGPWFCATCELLGQPSPTTAAE